MTRGLAAILNVLIWGAGYLYLGERTVTGGFLLAGYLLIHWYWIVLVGVMSALSNVETLVVFVGHLLISAGLAYDVYAAGEGRTPNTEPIRP